MRISHSACTTYLGCAYQYFLHYYRKLRPIDDKSVLVFGDAVDQGLNHLLVNRNVEEAVEIFKAHWTKRAKSGSISYSKSDLDEHLVDMLEFTDEKDKYFTSLILRGEILIREYATQILPRIKEVIKVQIEEEMENEEGDKLTIKTDFICRWEDDRIILFDNKTSSVKYKEDSVRTSPQLAIYYEGLKEEYKIDACGYIVIPKKINKKKKPAVNIEVIIDKVDVSTVNKTYSDFVNSLAGIKSAQFPKNKNNCQNIYGKCVYYNYCHNGSTEGLKEKV